MSIDILLNNPPLINFEIKNSPKAFIYTSFYPPIGEITTIVEKQIIMCRINGD